MKLEEEYHKETTNFDQLYKSFFAIFLRSEVSIVCPIRVEELLASLNIFCGDYDNSWFRALISWLEHAHLGSAVDKVAIRRVDEAPSIAKFKRVHHYCSRHYCIQDAKGEYTVILRTNFIMCLNFANVRKYYGIFRHIHSDFESKTCSSNYAFSDF